MASYLVLTKVDANLAPPRSSQRPRGRLVLPIFIRQGWPQAMSHLSGFLRPVLSPRIASVACANDATQRPLKTVGFPRDGDQTWTKPRSSTRWPEGALAWAGMAGQAAPRFSALIALIASDLSNAPLRAKAANGVTGYDKATLLQTGPWRP